MFLERVCNFVLKLKSEVALLYIRYIFLIKDSTRILNFDKEAFYEITFVSCGSIPKLEDIIWMWFTSEEIQIHMVILSMFSLYFTMWISIYQLCYYWYVYIFVNQFFNLSLLNVSELSSFKYTYIYVSDTYMINDNVLIITLFN